MKARFPSIVAGLCVLAGCRGPEAEGYFSGGISGFACPPGTEASSSCGDPDCEVPCVANTECESDESCPDGAVCDTSEGWCMPDSCAETGDCDAGQACETLEFSKGICLGAVD